MLPKRTSHVTTGMVTRIMERRRFVFGKARDCFNVDEITDLWNAQCVEQGRPDDQVARERISDDLRTGLKELAAETKTDAEAYRILLIARIEKVISTERFRTMLENAHLGAIDRYLKAMSQIAQLSGANAPTKIAETDSEGRDIIRFSEAERTAGVMRFLQMAQQRAIEAGVLTEAEAVVPMSNAEPSILDSIGHNDTGEADSPVS